MEPCYESSNHSRDLQHVSSIKKKKKKLKKKQKQAVLTPNRRSNSAKKKNDVVIHKSRELKQFAFLQ